MSGTALTVDQLQMQRFRERLHKIEKRGRKVEMAPLGAVEFDEKGRAKVTKAPTMSGRKARSLFRALMVSPFVMAFAILFGAFTVVAVRYGRLFWDGGALTGSGAGQAMLMDAGIALAVIIVLRLLLRARSRLMLAGQLVGVAAGVLAMHNLVHVAPQVWTAAFPPAWVDDILANTQPHSILIKGVSYVL